MRRKLGYRLRIQLGDNFRNGFAQVLGLLSRDFVRVFCRNGIAEAFRHDVFRAELIAALARRQKFRQIVFGHDSNRQGRRELVAQATAT